MGEAASVRPPGFDGIEDSFVPGTEVIIEGLTKCPDFNGKIGTVQSLDTETGRYNVMLAAAGASGPRLAKIKFANLRLAGPPPPPRFAPTLHLDEPQLGIGIAGPSCHQQVGFDIPTTPQW